MVKYTALKGFYSESQKRLLTEGEVIEVTDEKLIQALEESIKKHGTGFFKKSRDKKEKQEGGE